MRSRITAVIVVAVVAVTAPAAAAVAAAHRPLVRRDVASLTAKQRHRFVAALLKLKRTPSPYDHALSWYDQLVEWHAELTRCNPLDPFAEHVMRGHFGPVFLPWHRQYLLLLERALRSVTGRRMAVPYWDWTNPASTKAVFSDDFMGGDGDPGQGYAVTTGPFRKDRWHLNVLNFGAVYAPSNTPFITRHMGSFGPGSLPTRADQRAALTTPLYDVAPFNDASDPTRSFRNALEGYRDPLPHSVSGCLPDGSQATAPLGSSALHNDVHQWVGGALPPSPSGALRFGTLAVNVASPNDPVFFLLHSNVDRLWAQWQNTHGADTYAPASGDPDNDATKVLEPLDQAGGRPTPVDVADIRALGYRYGRTAAATTPAPATSSRRLICEL